MYLPRPAVQYDLFIDGRTAHEQHWDAAKKEQTMSILKNILTNSLLRPSEGFRINWQLEMIICGNILSL